jgi:hypothetical protein
MARRRILVVGALLAALLGGCGGRDSSSATSSTSTTAALPPLARTPPKPGELLFTGEASPRTHGPFTLKGGYKVRFEQFAPEDPRLDFSKQVPFTALLRTAGSRGPGDHIFGVARARGQRIMHGTGRRYELEVTFGDFPYAVRFTPDP